MAGIARRLALACPDWPHLSLLPWALNHTPVPMRILVLTLGALALSLSASAQDASYTAAYGEYSLRAGFTPDPLAVEVVAGGGNNVRVSSRCDYGRVGDAPDVEVTYSGSTGSDLFIYAVSSVDTTLLINLPDGRWVCNDDSYGDGDPLVRLGGAAGVYDIWVGTFGTTADATLMVSEIDPR